MGGRRGHLVIWSKYLMGYQVSDAARTARTPDRAEIPFKVLVAEPAHDTIARVERTSR
jgi:hypothetical protein